MVLRRIVSVTMVLCLLIVGLTGNMTYSVLHTYAEDDIQEEDAISEMDALVKKYGRTCGIMVWDMIDGELYSHGGDTLISGASLIKLPYCYYVCTEIEKGTHKLTEQMTYTASWYHGGSGYIWKQGYGETYTIRELLDFTLRYSDNVAYDMLVYLFGVEGFNDMVEDWGYDIRIGEYGPRFPMVTADFMCTAMQKMYERSKDGRQWSIVWKALCESTRSYIRDGMEEEEIPVAVKYGNETGLWHEACLIESDEPYILIVMTTHSYGPDVQFLQNVAECADRIMQEHLKYSPDTKDFDFTPLDDQKVRQGDLNGDEITDETDVLWVLIAAANIGAGYTVNMTAMQIWAADVDGDGEITAADAFQILCDMQAEEAAETESISAILYGFAENIDNTIV